jgi:Tfp pilus assembly protein PilO
MLTPPNIKTFVPGTNQERNHFIEIVMLVLVIGLFSWFVLRPKVADYKHNQQELAKLKEDSAKVAENKQKLFDLVAKLEQSKPQIASLDETLPLQQRTTTLAVLLDSLAQANGLNISSLAFDPQSIDTVIVAGDKKTLEDPYKDPRKVKNVTTLISVNGTLEQFMGFLGALEKSTRIIDVQTIDINGQEGEVLNFKVKIRSYTYSS